MLPGVESIEPTFPCPCCGWVVFEEPPGSYDICPVCDWEDDLAQLRFPRMDWGPNRRSLVDSQADWLRDGGRARSEAREATFERDQGWRLLDLDVDIIEIPEAGRNYGLTYAADRTDYYYWRQPHR